MAKLSVELQRYFLSDGAPSADQNSLSIPLHDALQEPSNEAISTKKEVTLNEILEIAGERTFGFLFVLLSLPSALPIPAPGYSTPFGIVMFLLAVQLIVGAEQPWLPEKFRRQGFERTTVQGFIRKGLPWLQRIETIARPRLTSVCTSRTGRLVIGMAIALMSISMMIPIPLTNTLPAIGIFVTGFGLLDDDGAISLAGITICTLALATTTTVLYLVLRLGVAGMEQAVEAAKNWVKP
ncbi:MAG: hypothetical protein DCF15_04320 [Phormidesmis priestleyi]|uniref:Exopolysaccharide biosynthesis protein n=1 Tax=Phormidesmis priestleyi TaxID=268141 RepID=A0A2W4XPB6_9CYAN|nr:MAG: hypothetical protein DCF15_04320 [Phormidesmis priestleyi]